ncbi:hypothetical protein FSP39_018168 [Pinctada imbricata]|uniref:CCHC-type domain-containing protein n=1 Tax=Pinctada imbricata TaxID=66713 RepID=A0AA88XDH1_PINIB|nr:hypothetical protein FSP39_018168 [Pinctada imbricata]
MKQKSTKHNLGPFENARNAPKAPRKGRSLGVVTLLITLQVSKYSFRGPQQMSWIAGQPVFQSAGGYGQYANPQSKPRGSCFSCGSFTHWRNQCPFNSARATATKSKAD